MKVVFLDFFGVMDGVYGPDDVRDTVLDRQCAAHLNRLTDATGAIIVVISDAAKRVDGIGHEEALSRVRRMLVEVGVTAQIVDCTDQGPESDSFFDRGAEIRTWLNAHPKVTDFVIFDDLPLPLGANRIEGFRKYWTSLGDFKATRDLIDRLPPPDEELEAQFLLINGDVTLTATDIDAAIALIQ